MDNNMHSFRISLKSSCFKEFQTFLPYDHCYLKFTFGNFNTYLFKKKRLILINVSNPVEVFLDLRPLKGLNAVNKRLHPRKLVVLFQCNTKMH